MTAAGILLFPPVERRPAVARYALWRLHPGRGHGLADGARPARRRDHPGLALSDLRSSVPGAAVADPGQPDPGHRTAAEELSAPCRRRFSRCSRWCSCCPTRSPTTPRTFAVARLLSDFLSANPDSLSFASALIVTKFALLAIPCRRHRGLSSLAGQRRSTGMSNRQGAMP